MAGIVQLRAGFGDTLGGERGPAQQLRAGMVAREPAGSCAQPPARPLGGQPQVADGGALSVAEAGDNVVQSGRLSLLKRRSR